MSLSAPAHLVRHSLGAPLPRTPHTADAPSRRAHCVPPLRAQQSGGRGGGGGGFSRGQGLIGLNGQPLTAGGGGGGGSNSGGGGGGLYLPFRKPAEEAAEAGLSVEEQLEVVRDRRGLWHEYAAVIVALGRQGMSPAMIMEATAMTGVEQNVVTTAAQVLNTLKSTDMDAALLAYFDVGGEEVLYELRVLAGAQRKAAAEYVARGGLDGKGAKELARAIKEYERRKREADGSKFSSAPGDCLAFAFYRQSVEERSRGDKESALQRAVNVAVTDSAKAFLSAALHACRNPDAPPSAATAATADPPRLQVLRLRADESQALPAPVLSCANDLARLPSIPQPDGPFRLFSPPPGLPWVALPAWPALRALPSLFALLLPSSSLLPPLQSWQGQGPVLAVVAGGWGQGNEAEVQERWYYVVKDEEKGGSFGLVVVGGGEVKARYGEGAERLVVGRVVLALLPPDPDAEAEDADVADWE